MFLVESSLSPRICPACRGELHYRDRRKRIHRLAGGRKEYYLIRRLYCRHCRKLHAEIPDCMIPRKHYDAEIIADVLDGKVTQDSLECEDYPCAATMTRWIRWFQDNRTNIEGHLHRVLEAVGKVLPVGHGGSWISYLRAGHNINPEDSWLKVSLRIIYNSGGALSAGPPDAPALFCLSQAPSV